MVSVFFYGLLTKNINKMNNLLEIVNELNEALNNGYGVPNMEWVKTKVKELQNVVKENCTIPDVSNNEVAVCDHPFNSVETDKLGNFLRCNKCGESFFEQTDC